MRIQMKKQKLLPQDLLTYKCTYRGGFNLGTILFTERYKENRQTLNKKESIVETVSNVTVSVLTSGITMATVGTLLELFLPIDYCHSLAIFLEEELAVLVSDTVAVLVQLIHPARDQRSKRTDHIYENVWNHTENYGDELMNYGLITSKPSY